MKNIIACLGMLICLSITLSAQQKELVEYEVYVKGACGMCSERIEETAIKKGGAEQASYDLETQMLTVTIDENKVSITGVQWEIAQAGHATGSHEVPVDVYNDLPLCCQYDDPNNPHKMGDADHMGLEIEPLEETVYLSLIEGYIYGQDGDVKEPLIGANVTLGDSGVGETTDSNGYFSIDNSEVKATEVSFSYIGYDTQVHELTQDGIIEVVLFQGVKTEEVDIVYKKRTTEISFIKPLNIEQITREELCKAACCNLSESFETNPSVDVAFPDAITGTRTIQMLGLASPYVQITRELLPDVRGMSSIYGMSMTPGPWIEGIQLIKGAGSVINGYESIAGQINVDLKKPEAGERLFLNGYVNNGGRIELNANTRQELSEYVSTGFLLHAKQMQAAHDNNGDGFTDMPMEKDFVVSNRWKFDRKKNFLGQLGIKYSNLNHEGGYHDHFSGASQDHANHWRMNSDVQRWDLWGRVGHIFPEKSQNSIGLQVNAVYHKQNSEFGFQLNNNEQKSLYLNLTYQNIISDSHILRGGVSYHHDDVFERIGKSGIYDRNESVPGAYVEYTYKQANNKLSIIPGLRIDHHNQYGTMIVPRLHAKYNFAEKTIMRLTAGRGWRTASIFAENIGLFSTQRRVEIAQTNADNPYGLDAEVAWNMGLNLTQGFDIGRREMIISIDAYRTDFSNQIIVDYETPTVVSFYNLDGQSYSNSFQVKVEYELFDDFDIRTAYRLFDVKKTFDGELLQAPMVAKHRAFVNMAYKTSSDWHIDATLNWNGQKRLPNTSSNPEKYRRPDYSPNYFLLNAQIMKRWNDVVDIYLGGENLLNYKQTDAIIAADDAFGQFFDASIVWAPLFGRNIYLGFRYNLAYK